MIRTAFLFLCFKTSVVRRIGNPCLESNNFLLCSVAEGPVSYKLAYLPPAMSGTLKLIQDCGIPSLMFCNEYLYKFNPPLILDSENGSRNGLKFTGNIILKGQLY